MEFDLLNESQNSEYCKPLVPLESSYLPGAAVSPWRGAPFCVIPPYFQLSQVSLIFVSNRIALFAILPPISSWYVLLHT